MPIHSASLAARGSATSSEVVSKCMVGLRLGSYFGQPQSPLVANDIQPACIIIGKRLRRIRAKKRFCSEAEVVKDKRNLYRMGCAEPPAKLRRTSAPNYPN